MRKTSLNMVYELAKQDPRIVFIGSDLGVGTLDQFKTELPSQFFMEGVSEANVVGMAAGMALEGKIPYVNTIATFLTRRCFEQVVLDLCLHHLNVRLIGNGGGLVYAPLGPTHLAIDDIAIMRSIPNMTIVAPADADEMLRFMPHTVDYKGPIYIRLAKGHDPIITDDKVPFEIGKGIPIRQGSDGLVITTGITLRLAQEAAKELSRQSIEIGILHMPTIKPLDRQMVLKMASDVPEVIVIEEHNVIGGLGSAIGDLLLEADAHRKLRFHKIGLPDVFPDKYGSQNSLMQHYHISADRITSIMKQSHNVKRRPHGTVTESRHPVA